MPKRIANATAIAAMLAATTTLAVAIAAAPASAATQWRTYINGRFGAVGEVPSDWLALQPPINGDGRRFASPDGTATMTIAGIFGTAADFDIFANGNDGQTVTYSHRTSDTATVSGTSGDRIFYEKSILGCAGQVWISAYIEYPAAAKAAFDPIVIHVADALHFATEPACGGASAAAAPATPAR